MATTQQPGPSATAVVETPKAATDPRLLALATLVQLEQQLRTADTDLRLLFILANETARLVRYRQSAVWLNRTGRIETLSGLADIDYRASYVVWLTRLLKHLSAERTILRPISAQDLPASIGADWDEWFPKHAVWVPLGLATDRVVGGLFLVRDDPWGEGDLRLLATIGEAAGHALLARKAVHRPHRRHSRWIRSTLAAVALAAALTASIMIKIPLSVLAPAEVVPQVSATVRASLPGVIEQIIVAPNQPVAQGDIVASLDKRDLLAQVRLSERALHLIAAEYRQTAQAALVDPSKARDLGILEARLLEKQTELEYAQETMERADIRAPIGGTAVYEDPDTWIGQPVRLGDPILDIAQTDPLELRINLPIRDAIPLKVGARVSFFPDTDPDRILPAKLRYIATLAQPTPEGIVAFTLNALMLDASDIDGDAGGFQTRIGQRGVAKIDGSDVSVLYALTRRPLAVIRQWFGY